MTNTTESAKITMLELKDGAMLRSDIGGTWRLLTDYEIGIVEGVMERTGRMNQGLLVDAICRAKAIAIKLTD